MKTTFLTTAHYVFAMLIAAVIVSESSADVVWTGAFDSGIQNDANYDFSGSALSTIAGIQGSTVGDNIIYTNMGAAPELPNTGGQLNFGTSGFELVFDNVVAGFAPGSNKGWRGGTLSLLNAAQTTSFFISGSTASIDATSSMTLLGAGNPVNMSTIDMAFGAVVTFTNKNPSAFNNDHIADFTVNGAPLVDGVNATVVSDGAAGTIVTAVVPEPASFCVLALAGICLVIRRRK